MEDYYGRMKAYYERRAAEYDDAYLGTGAYSGRDWPGFEEELDQVRTLLERFPHTTVLDAGCGTGFLTRHLRGEVVGVGTRARVSSRSPARGSPAPPSCAATRSTCPSPRATSG